MADGSKHSGSEQAPADWYDDPAAPGRLRYFDGQSWTDHYHEPDTLPAIDNWLQTTLSVIGQHWRALAVLAFCLSVVANTVIWVGVRAIVGELAVVNEDLVNITGTVVFGTIVLVLFALVWQCFGWLVLSRFMHVAHFQGSPTVADSLGHALRRLPRLVLFVVTLAIAAMFVTSLISTIAFVSPLLGALLWLMAMVGLVWVLVKLAFLVTVIAVAPPGTAPIGVSADVSTDRFLPVLGRLALITVSLWIGSIIIVSVFGSAGQLFDGQTLSNGIALEDGAFVFDDIRFADLLPSSDQLVSAIVINSIASAASSIISTSAFVRLYLDSGAPAEAI